MQKQSNVSLENFAALGISRKEGSSRKELALVGLTGVRLVVLLGPVLKLVLDDEAADRREPG